MEKNGLTHRDRIQNCLAGNKLDRIPIALWRHFPVDDQYPERLASATIAFQEQFDFDLVKVTPSSSFCIKDWGAADKWEGNPEGTREYTKRVIKHPDDWAQLSRLEPLKGHLGEQINALKTITRHYNGYTPVLQTIFSPLSQAKNLVGPDLLPVHLRLYPEALHEGLKIITNTILDFLNEVISSKVDGIFYAIQHAQYRILTTSEYKEFGSAYDLEILNAISNYSSLWANMLHLHGNDVMFDEIVNFPVQIINWHDRQTSPTLSEARSRFSGCVCGGLRQWDTMVLGTPEQVELEARQAIESTNRYKFILGTGCVLPTTAPYGNIMAAIQSSK